MQKGDIIHEEARELWLEHEMGGLNGNCVEGGNGEGGGLPGAGVACG